MKMTADLHVSGTNTEWVAETETETRTMHLRGDGVEAHIQIGDRLPGQLWRMTLELVKGGKS